MPPFFPKNSLVGFIPTSCIHVVLLFFPSLSLNSIWFHPSGFILQLFPTFSFWLPASLPPAAGGRFRGPGGDDLTVDGAQQQHEPDGSEHLGGRYPMRLWDSYIQDCCCHCEGDNEKVSRLWFKHSWRTPLHLFTDFSSVGFPACTFINRPTNYLTAAHFIGFSKAGRERPEKLVWKSEEDLNSSSDEKKASSWMLVSCCVYWMCN